MFKRILTLALAAVIIACALMLAWEHFLRPQIELARYPVAFTEYVERYAVEAGVPREILYAVILTESGFDPDAVSAVGAKGLMQLMDDTNEWIALMSGEDAAPERIFEPELNIRRGVWLLARLYRQFGGWREALAAYNAGIGRVQSWLENPDYTDDGRTLSYIPIGETRAYVERVMRAAERYRELYFS